MRESNAAIPALLNPASGSATRARAVLNAVQRPSRGIQGLIPERAIETYLTSHATVEMVEEPGSIAIDL